MQQYDEVSLDDLFVQLKQEISGTNKKTKNSEQQGITEFQKIQKSISNLPKLTASLTKNSKNEISPDAKKILKISDPIPITKKTIDSKTPKDAGDKWFNMPKHEVTPQLKRDLMVIQKRSVLDPKRHYKKEKWEIPKFFQIGTIVESKADFYSARLNKKNRGTSLVNEILNEGATNKYFKRKYNEIQNEKTSGKKNHYKKVKAMRSKK
ncbi:hypothetical protein PACTADRAFT_42564 [Pachysolen tannophilus NRRL Y-2460]|uniref:Fcf2 pre-rRNA processing C-terminal domain-containing protein n=1 Tax=Pachysolen tannophilus NRRL Y-2460 TaxID=669874 RepID=A0A1E4TUJ5_PACTA|nr:hypothetical protein PACTADRAFT_42564 [Pachysolen tannophilus NRRL Y-2460]